MNTFAVGRVCHKMQPVLSTIISSRCSLVCHVTSPGYVCSASRPTSTLKPCHDIHAHVQPSAKLCFAMNSMVGLHRSTTASCLPQSKRASSGSWGLPLRLGNSSLASRVLLHGVSTAAVAAAAAAGSSGPDSRAPAPRRVRPRRSSFNMQLQQQQWQERQHQQDQPDKQQHDVLAGAPKQRLRPPARSRQLSQQQQSQPNQQVPAALNKPQSPQQQPTGAQLPSMLSQHDHQALPSTSPLPTSPSWQEVHAYLRSVQGPGGFLSDEDLRRVSEYLSELNEEQWEAVQCRAQHLRLIAGPGSGKTRTLAARVAWLLAHNTSPEQFLVITFTRKAAGELVERITSLMGPAVTKRLRPCTFHALCHSLLRKYHAKMNIEDFVIATEDDAKAIITAIVYPGGKKGQKGSSTMPSDLHQDNADTQDASGLVRSSKAGDSSSLVPAASILEKTGSTKSKKNPVMFLRSAISRLKNFVQEVEGRSGLELIQETRNVGLALVPQPLIPAVAQVYDKYQQAMRSSNMLDFDDLLHCCLALVKNDAQVRAALHSHFQHVLVDESQDTNPCQFELVRAITGSQARLVMVGDPDQAIYGFRGANSQLLSQVFSVCYQGTADTRYLSRNYRSRVPITQVADIVRRQHRTNASLLKQGISMRPKVSNETVRLVQAESQDEEAEYVIEQLMQWKQTGYLLGEMALLFRTRNAAQFMYRELIKAGVPAHLHQGKDFWDSVELKTVVAMLRCLVQPAGAGDMIKSRLVNKSGVQVPIMMGVGDTSLAKLEEHIKNHITSTCSTCPATLGSCLLPGCADDGISPADAAYIVQQWLAAAASPGGGGADASRVAWDEVHHTPESDAVLEQLAPPWCSPEGFTGIKTQKARAAVARLRGLVVLGRAAAVIHTPAQVLQLLLTASGVWSSLQRDASMEDEDAIRRIDNLELLMDYADDTKAYDIDIAAETEQLINMLSLSSVEGPSSDSSDSSSSSDPCAVPSQQPAEGIAILRSFYNYCALQGEGDENNKAGAWKVQLLTMHASKGKEFPCVGVMRVCDSVVPGIREDDCTPNALEQERNTLFVAMTRAKDHLLVSWPKKLRVPSQYVHLPYRDIEQSVSRFLEPVLAACKKQLLPGVVYTHKTIVASHQRRLIH